MKIWFDVPATQMPISLHFVSARVFTAQKWSFPLRISSVNVTKSPENCDLVIFTEEILNGKLHFVCSVYLTVIFLRQYPYNQNEQPKLVNVERNCVYIRMHMYIHTYKHCIYIFLSINYWNHSWLESLTERDLTCRKGAFRCYAQLSDLQDLVTDWWASFFTYKPVRQTSKLNDSCLCPEHFH